MSEATGNERTNDGRKYEVGDRVDFTDDSGKIVPGVVHAVRYQEGRYELAGEHRPDMFSPEGPDNLPIPGTGHMVLIAGTENERHSFEYIMVHEAEHTAWWAVENANKAKLKPHHEAMKIYNKKIQDLPDEEIKKVEIPIHPLLENQPPLKQHIRIFEED